MVQVCSKNSDTRRTRTVYSYAARPTNLLYISVPFGSRDAKRSRPLLPAPLGLATSTSGARPVIDTLCELAASVGVDSINNPPRPARCCLHVSWHVGLAQHSRVGHGGGVDGLRAGSSLPIRLVECVTKSWSYAACMSGIVPPFPLRLSVATNSRVFADGNGGSLAHALGAVRHGPTGARSSTARWEASRNSYPSRWRCCSVFTIAHVCSAAREQRGSRGE